MNKEVPRIVKIVLALVFVAFMIIVGAVMAATPKPRNNNAGPIGKTPVLTPMEHFKTVHHHGCWLLITDDGCYTIYYYVGTGTLEDVIAAVHASLSQNPNYELDALEDSLVTNSITIKDKDPSNSTTVWGVEFTPAPKSPDDPHPFFQPTKDCQFGSSNCVEAQVVI